MSLIIFNYTLKICKQTLNTGPTAKTKPFFYEPVELDLKILTQSEIDHLWQEAQAIQDQLMDNISNKPIPNELEEE